VGSFAPKTNKKFFLITESHDETYTYLFHQLDCMESWTKSHHIVTIAGCC